MALKWGIISAGKIANDFAAGLSIPPYDEHSMVAIAARDKNRADEFAKKFNIPRAYGSYLELAKDDEVEIVYIGVINTKHLQVTEMMLEHGKHVLCEKPLGLNCSEVNKMVKKAQKKRLFFMEAIWSRCNPIYEKIRQELAAGTIGNVRQVITNFCTEIKTERVRKKHLGGGGLLDIGIYCLQFATMVFGNAEPSCIQVAGALNEDGVDEYGSILLKFKEKKIATITYSISNRFDKSASIIGSKGIIKVYPPFYTPTKMEINGTPFEIKIPETTHALNFTNSGGLRFEADHVKKCLKEGLLESPLVPHSNSLLLSRIMDVSRHQLGVIYD